ncbi:MAG: hypothetical protein ABIN58_13545 [candidate division WOR-3 bacterium]
MPFDHIIDHGARLVVVRGRGEGSLEETADSCRRLLEDQSIDADYAFLFVVDDIALDPTPHEMRSIMFLLEVMLSRFCGRMAIATTHVGRVTAANLIALAADAGRGRLRAFTSEGEARRWLLQTVPQ